MVLLAFIEAEPGRTVFNVSMSKTHPVIARAPSRITNIPAHCGKNLGRSISDWLVREHASLPRATDGLRWRRVSHCAVETMPLQVPIHRRLVRFRALISRQGTHYPEAEITLKKKTGPLSLVGVASQRWETTRARF